MMEALELIQHIIWALVALRFLSQIVPLVREKKVSVKKELDVEVT